MSGQNPSGLRRSADFTFLLGRVHDKIGGPTRTIWGYVDGLKANGKSARIVGLGSIEDLESSFGPSPASENIAVQGKVFDNVKTLLRLYRSQPKDAAFVIVGVWHLPFFVLGLLRTLSTLIPGLEQKQVFLIPTMSLTEYDWEKHRWIKTCLKPLVGLFLLRIDGVIFASTGELEQSRPRKWRRAEVILHPSVSINSPTASGNLARDIDVLFVGRLDPQKDLPLLLSSFSKTNKSNKLHIVGDGRIEYVHELRLLASTLGLEDRVVWHGWKSHGETLDYLRRARVVAVTSLVENYCHAAVEALVAESDLVLVDRVMSAVDFARLADIDVTRAEPTLVASCIQARLDGWEARQDSRAASASAIRDACSPAGAASAVERFIADPGLPLNYPPS